MRNKALQAVPGILDTCKQFDFIKSETISPSINPSRFPGKNENDAKPEDLWNTQNIHIAGIVENVKQDPHTEGNNSVLKR